MGKDSFFGGNLLGQENWELRGANEGRVRSLETSRTADETTLAALPKGSMFAPLGSPTASSAIALSQGNTESIALTSPAIATTAGRRYKITGFIHWDFGGGATNFVRVHVRRGTTTGGTDVGFADSGKPAVSVGRTLALVIATDVPGAQAAQQWSLTFQADASVCDCYNPSFLHVEDIGAI